MARNIEPPAIAGAIDPGEAPLKPETIEADPVASAEWDRRVGGIDAAEAGALAAYCSTFSRRERLQAEVDKLKDVYVETPTGGLKMHPVFGAINAVERLLGMHAARLGYTPVDRSRVTKRKPETAASKVKKLSKYVR